MGTKYDRILRRLESRDRGLVVEVCPYPGDDKSGERAAWIASAVDRGVVVIPYEMREM